MNSVPDRSLKIKICGVTSVGDALACAAEGADMIGLNFYPKSPRYVSPETARTISAALGQRARPITLVGVFVNEPPHVIRQTLDYCALHLAQLSGDEPDDVVRALGAHGFKAVRALPARPPAQSATTHAPDLLLDAHVTGEYGGTGRVADWGAAARLATESRLLLAGGLNPANVGEAILRVRPWGVDVASGVESAPGVKEASKVRAFIAAARKAHRQLLE